MADHQEPSVCMSCDNPGTQLCSGCKSIRYCSTACQRIDWPVHKIICKDYLSFASTRPDLDHHSAIYFNPDGSQPCFVWLPFDSGHNHPSLDHLAQFGVCADRIKAKSFEELSCNPMLKRHIDSHHILLSMPEASHCCPSCNNDLKPNESLRKIDEELANHFRGPILALSTPCERDLQLMTSDFDLGPVDFRHIVDNLRMLYCQCEDMTRWVLEGANIRAVRLNCMGDTIFVDRPILEAVFEPKSALLFDSEIPTPIADKIGLPLIARKVPPAVVWRDSSRPCRIENQKVRMLNPPEQTSDTGSVILLRKDGKPLHPIHVRALLSYTATTLLDPIHSQDSCMTADKLVAARIDQVTMDKFQSWYSAMWQTCSIRRPFIPSPFDIEDDFNDEVEDEDAGFDLMHG